MGKDFWWRVRPYVEVLPQIFLVVAFLIFYVPIIVYRRIPAFTTWAERPYAAHSWSWNTATDEILHSKSGDDPRAYRWTPIPDDQIFCTAIVPVALSFTLLAIASSIFFHSLRIYNGRMLVMPNREERLYGRLWCVFEIYAAMKFNIRVRLGNTLANAGSCSSHHAKCSSDADKRLLQDDIVATMGEKGYSTIDAAIAAATRTAKQSTFLAASRWFLVEWFILCGTFRISVPYFPPAAVWGSVFGTGAAMLICCALFYKIAVATQGCIRPRWIALLTVSFLFLGVMMNVFGYAVWWWTTRNLAVVELWPDYCNGQGICYFLSTSSLVMASIFYMVLFFCVLASGFLLCKRAVMATGSRISTPCTVAFIAGLGTSLFALTFLLVALEGADFSVEQMYPVFVHSLSLTAGIWLLPMWVAFTILLRWGVKVA